VVVLNQRLQMAFDRNSLPLHAFDVNLMCLFLHAIGLNLIFLLPLVIRFSLVTDYYVI